MGERGMSVFTSYCCMYVCMYVCTDTVVEYTVVSHVSLTPSLRLLCIYKSVHAYKSVHTNTV